MTVQLPGAIGFFPYRRVEWGLHETIATLSIAIARKQGSSGSFEQPFDRSRFDKIVEFVSSGLKVRSISSGWYFTENSAIIREATSLLSDAVECGDLRQRANFNYSTAELVQWTASLDIDLSATLPEFGFPPIEQVLTFFRAREEPRQFVATRVLETTPKETMLDNEELNEIRLDSVQVLTEKGHIMYAGLVEDSYFEVLNVSDIEVRDETKYWLHIRVRADSAFHNQINNDKEFHDALRDAMSDFLPYGIFVGSIIAASKGRRSKDTASELGIDSLAKLKVLLDRFHLVARQLARRQHSREPLLIKDEYDVQDLLHSLLRLHFDDIRPEEYTPSYGGSSSKMDFLLKDEQIVVEAKHTRDSLREKKLSEELTIDIAKYKGHQDCKNLICFIYDPEHLIANPKGLIRDLEEHGKPHLPVTVLISPPR